MQKTFFKKVGLILCLGAFLVLIDACYGAHCNCPEITKKFFDFQSISLEVRRHSIDIEQNNIPSGHTANIDIVLEDVEFLVQTKISNCRHSWFINSAFACSCIGEGYEGLKFPVTDIRVYSDADYSEDIDAGELLNDIIKVRDSGIEGGEISLSDLEDKNSLFSAYESNVRLFIDMPPTVDSTHTLTVEIDKENGETITTETMPITWL